jgi:microcystin-dependent protein
MENIDILTIILIICFICCVKRKKEKFQTSSNKFIVAWNGSVIPEGWVLCDGLNGTPDLRGRFILGVYPGKNEYEIGNTGGEEKHKLTIQELPRHAHSYFEGGWFRVCSHCQGPEVGDNPNERLVQKETSYVGLDQPHNNMPPYYVLAYIMKK